MVASLVLLEFFQTLAKCCYKKFFKFTEKNCAKLDRKITKSLALPLSTINMDHLEKCSSFFTLSSVISYRNQPFDLQHKSN